MAKIVEIQLKELQARLLERSITLKVSEPAKAWLGAKGYDPHYGARPLRRQIQLHIQNPLAEDLIAGKYSDGHSIFVDISDIDVGLIFHKNSDVFDAEL